jgi:hypothetical protein
MDAAIPAALPDQRFVSRRDAWLVAVLWAASLVDFGLAAWLWLAFERGAALLGPLLAAAGAFQLHALYSSHYTLEGAALVIRASFFRWRVPLAAIDSIEPSRSPLSGPACSLDRLQIRYGARRILISPEDKTGFLHAVAARAPQFEAGGGGARLRPATG